MDTPVSNLNVAADPQTTEKTLINSLDHNLFKRTQKRKVDATMSKQNQLLTIACDYLSKSDGDLDIAKIWAGKLKSLAPDQKLFAEKAINDILFEAQLGNLSRHSVRINEDAQPLSPFSSASTSLTNSHSYTNTSKGESIHTPVEIQLLSPSSIQSNISPTYKNQGNQDTASTYFSNFTTYTNY